MKTITFYSSLLVLIALGTIIMSFTTPGALVDNMAILPDLRVSQVATPGGLCVRPNNKVRVTVTNSQMVAVKDKISVTLFVSPKQGNPTSYVGYLEKGIGPKDNFGKPVWFNDVKLDYEGEVTIRAIVDHVKEIEETNDKNNEKITKVKVKNCGGNTAAVQGARLEVTAYADGTWSGGNYQAINGATVKVVRNGQTYNPDQTTSNGKYIFNSIPKGMCKISVIKTGYQNVEQSYNMPTYTAKKNIGLQLD